MIAASSYGGFAVCPVGAQQHQSSLQRGGAQWGWRLPLDLSDKNTTTNFKVDSTWHLVEGRTSSISGNIWLADPTDPLSVRAEIRFPLAQFDSDSSMRDSRMREVMDSEHFPQVRLYVDAMHPQCDQAAWLEQGRCQVKLEARLAIRGIERPITLAASMVKKPNSMIVSGESVFSWLDFGIEDPSILVAKLEPQVAVTFSVEIPVTN